MNDEKIWKLYRSYIYSATIVLHPKQSNPFFGDSCEVLRWRHCRKIIHNPGYLKTWINDSCDI